jgi:drug/metabolite transporter (DMT)-like permease
VAYLLWYRGIRDVDASVAGIFTGLIPISSVVGSVIVLGERLRPAVVVAAAFVITAIGVSPRRRA